MCTDLQGQDLDGYLRPGLKSLGFCAWPLRPAQNPVRSTPLAQDARQRAFFCFERREGPIWGNRLGKIRPAHIDILFIAGTVRFCARARRSLEKAT
jgi:hypothetical protein